MNPMEAEQNKANASFKYPSEMPGFDIHLCRCENNGDYCDHCLEVEALSLSGEPDDRY
jgi:hypothetical protein